jgi:hypothetical protein
VEVSFEELCSEPGLLGNLLSCMSPDKVLIAAKEALPRGKQPPTHLQAAELAQSAGRAVAAILRVREAGVGQRRNDKIAGHVWCSCFCC